MAIPKTEKIWHNGKLINWDDAQLHVMSHVVNYGSSGFEGVRCYKHPQGAAIFRAQEHAERLLHSAKVYRMEVPFTEEEIVQAMVDVVAHNGVYPCYIRPIVLRGYGEAGVDVCVSSWTRIAPNTLPAMAKSGANYMNSQLIKMEAILNGYVEGIALDVNGYVSEGSGENLFAVRKGTVFTAPLGNSVLPGITRATAIDLIRELGFPVVEQMIPREMLYIADEVFFTGTAAQITPIRTVDKIAVGDG